MFAMTAGEALLALHTARNNAGNNPEVAAARRNNTILADQIYEGIGNLALAGHCLDHGRAWGVAGWPVEDVLHGYRERVIEPAKPELLRLINAVDRDLSMDRIEHLLASEPLLAWRFLRFANSAGFGLRNTIESLRHGLMILGLSTLRHWLMQQLTSASDDSNLQPVRQSMVLRSQLMEQLLDAGDQDSLRREVVLCGLLSQIDLLAGEPLNIAMQRIPVSERVLGAVLSNTGPYAPYLQIATALEYPAMVAVPRLCADNDIDIADVNRTLLRVLTQVRSH
jgi:c-di-GMP-related signal transduction protein